jgi:hypothetical protein
MNAAAQILLKQLKHLQDIDNSLKNKAAQLNSDLLELGKEQVSITQSIGELQVAIDILSKPQVAKTKKEKK